VEVVRNFWVKGLCVYLLSDYIAHDIELTKTSSLSSSHAINMGDDYFY
jgi:hypothetical protein